MWEAVERYYQLCYWAPEVRGRGNPSWFEGILDELLRTRVAPLGAVSPETVQSYFIIRQIEFIELSQMRGPLRRLTKFLLLVFEV